MRRLEACHRSTGTNKNKIKSIFDHHCLGSVGMLHAPSGAPRKSSGGRIIARYDRRECGPVDGEIADSHAYAPEEERAAQSWRGFFF